MIYLAGIFSGSLATSLTDPEVFLAGSSGGVYALMVGTCMLINIIVLIVFHR